MDQAKENIENYKSCQDIPILTVGKYQALLLTLPNFAIILMRTEEFHNKKHEIYRFVPVAKLRPKNPLSINATLSKMSSASHTSLDYFECTTQQSYRILSS